MSKNGTTETRLHRLVIWLVRMGRDFGGIPLLIGVFGGAIALFIWAVSAVSTAIQEWSGGITDPVERGLSYVAIAIVVHAFFGDGRKVEVKTNETPGAK